MAHETESNMEPAKHRNIAPMLSVVAAVTRFGNAIIAAVTVFLGTMAATDEVGEKSNATQTTKKRKRTTQLNEEAMANSEPPPPPPCKKARIYERGATKQRKNGAALPKTAARARNGNAKSKIKFSNATNSSKGTAVIFGPNKPTFSGNETLHLNAELTFNNLLNETPTPAIGRTHAYKPFDFDPITNPTGARPREGAHYDDQGLVYVLNTAYNATQTWFPKSLLRNYNGFDIRYHIKQHVCVGNAAIVRDDAGGLWYLAYGGVQALWGAKGGIVVGSDGNAKLKHHDPKHSTYINKELVKHDPLRNGK
ncbi:hypothetical protein LTR56_015255 [Elasticomyces elasticus]|nr:hypothetical protein LTR56_015255 [Elasticomyces elasticus]KAK3644283.1 hypothetical protein LTR22_015287 [Elasticomyces elasticus]KAK4905544.1 hypothetical protein LTR49_025175 [Elasticomyces elasticus]KAK5742888.1 hypothetical protein LTS12_024071 [Elasticomyces elasticus]